MKEKLLRKGILLFLTLVLPFLTIAQVVIKGKIISGDDNQPLPGAAVSVKGTTAGTLSDNNGNFSITTKVGQVLVFTTSGYNSKQITVGTGNNLKVTLEINAKLLRDVVVTGALGVKRQAKELGFASTTISSKSLTEAHPTNFTNGLTGKVPGLVISTVDNGINPETRFTLRGNRHITGNNFALVVLNGVPISPNEVNNINPDDIADVNILNGAGAAALYGSEASNGALIITTKKGTSNGIPAISYTNTFQIEQISYFPKLQTQFGGYGGEGGTYVDPYTNLIFQPVPFENQSYGPKYDGHLQILGLPTVDSTIQKFPYTTQKIDPRLAFFNLGKSDQNNLSYASGDDKNSFNFSINYLTKTGVVPNDKYNRTTARISSSKTYGIFKVDITGGYTHSVTSTYGSGFDGSALDGGRTLYSDLLNTPSWVPLQNYKNIDAKYADPNSYFNSYGVNPYWTINKSRYNTTTDNFNGSINAVLTPTKWFDLNYRLATNFGFANQQYTRAQVNFSVYARNNPGNTGNQAYTLVGPGTSPGVVPGQVSNIYQFGDGSITGGRLIDFLRGPQGFSRVQQDVLANFHKTFFGNLKANLLIGNTIWQEKVAKLANSSTNLAVEGFYNVGTIAGVPTTSETSGLIRQTAYFGALNLGFKDFVFLEGTLRNENDSRLPAASRSFWYPSIKGSLILTQAIDALHDNKIITYAKFRASYSKVGDVNAAPYSYSFAYNVNPGFPYGNTGGLSLSTTLNNSNLKPETTREFEFGGDFGFLESRINASFTYYNNHTNNQTLTIATSPSIGYNNVLVNVGEVVNRGWELKLDVDVLRKANSGVGLNLGGNLGINNSEVISLISGLNQITLTEYVNPNASIQAVVGQAYPVVFGSDVNRDPQGRVIVDAITGQPSTNPALVNLGRTTPKYTLGLTQTVSWKALTFNAVSEFRAGYVVFNYGLSEASAAGVSDLTAQTGRQKFIFPNSVIKNPDGTYTKNTNVTTSDGAYDFFQKSAYYNAASTYITDGSFWKLREVNLSYDLTSLIKSSKFLKRASISLNGRNLIMIRPKSNTWSDPEFSDTPGNAVGGNSSAQLPPTRFYGASINVTF